MDIKTIFGLPAHPLFVHVPVVLIPLVALGAIAMVLSARVRERLGWTVLGLAIVAGLSTQLAVSSGKGLQHSVANSASLRHHIRIAESIRPLALLLFVVALVVMLADRRGRGAWPYAGRPRATTGTPVRALLVVATVVVAVGTNIRLFQIGDSGAKATWERTRIGAASPGPSPGDQRR